MKTVTIVLTSLSLVIMVLILAHGFFGVPAAIDDYIFFVRARTMSAIDLGVHNFTHWDGRVLNFITVAALVRDIDTLFAATTAWTTGFILISFFMERLLRLSFPFSDSTGERMLRVGIILCALWLGMRDILSHTVLWASAGAYSVWATAGLLWLWLLFRRFIVETFHGFSPGEALCWIGGSVILGALTQNLSVPIILAIVVFFVRAIRDGNSHAAIWLIALFIAVCAGLLSLMIAPGLYVRANLMPSALKFDPRSLALNFQLILSEYIQLSLRLIPFCLAAAAILALHLPVRDSKRKPPMGAWFWFALALGAVLPMTAVPDLGIQKRTATFFQVFLAIGIVQSAIPLFQSFIKHYITKTWGRSILAPVLCALLFLPGVYLIARDLSMAYTLRQDVYTRHAWIVKNARPKIDMVIPRIRANVPTPVFFYDFRSDPDDEFNVWAAKFYGVKSIRTEK